LSSISRRTFLGTGVAAVVAPAASALARTTARADTQAAPATAAGLPDIVVVGAGVFGAWTALTLLERGAKVTLLDASGPGHPRATSCDEVRQIRMSYGDREVYTRSAMHALKLWKAREQEFGRKLVFPGGRLVMRRAWNKELEDQKAIFDRLLLPYDVLKPEEMSRRYPQVGFEGVGVGFLDIDAGLLRAREAMMAITETFERKGGSIRLARATPGATAGRTLQSATLDGGGTLSAGVFVFACGPWLRHVFPDLLGKVITTSRIEIAYIGSPAGDNSYRQGVLPNRSEEDTFPGAPGEVSYTQSDIVAGLKIARGGGSGHGFKHGPVVGEYMADRVTGRAAAPELERVFSLAGRG
jgi:sarcosine oxidase